MWKQLASLLIVLSVLASCQAPTVAIPALDTQGDVYKTEGANDPLIYGSTVGQKTVIMLYADFSDALMKIDTEERGKVVLGNGTFEKLFYDQSYGKMTFDIEHVHGTRCRRTARLLRQERNRICLVE